MAVLARSVSVLRGRWYISTSLAKHWLRRIALRHGYYERTYKRRMGRVPDYENPRTFSEKLAWMRLYDHNPLYTTLVDKLAVRDYVRERVGEDVLIPLYGVWERAEDIDFDSLPDSFVLKCNHESGFVIICQDKSKLDTTYVRAQLAARLRMNYYYRCGEWPYLNIKPRIMAEKLLTNEDGGEPTDYKFHCFNGKPQYIYAMKDRHTRHLEGCYSLDWQLLPFITSPQMPKELIPRPRHLDRMLQIATVLSEGLPAARPDLYEVKDRVYFGEITIISNAGILNYNPASYDRYWGDRLELPNPRCCP